MSNLLLIDSRVPDINGITGSLTTNTDYIVFDYYNDTFNSIKERIIKPYLNVGIAQHNYQESTCKILDKMSPATLIDVSFVDADLTTWDISMSVPIYETIDVSSIQMVNEERETIVWNTVTVDVSNVELDENGIENIVWTTETMDVSSIAMEPVFIETVVWNSTAVDISSIVIDENGVESILWTTQIMDISSLVMQPVQVEKVVWTKQTVQTGIEKTAGFVDFLCWLKVNGAENVDFLACYLWKNDNWKYVIWNIREKYDVWIRASIDITGWGGNFILESDGADMIGIYFTEAIFNYRHAFATTILTPQLNRIDTSGTNLLLYWNYGEQLSLNGTTGLINFPDVGRINTLLYDSSFNRLFAINNISGTNGSGIETNWSNDGSTLGTTWSGNNLIIAGNHFATSIELTNINAVFTIISASTNSQLFNVLNETNGTPSGYTNKSNIAVTNYSFSYILYNNDIFLWFTTLNSSPHVYRYTTTKTNFNRGTGSIIWSNVSLSISTQAFYIKNAVFGNNKWILITSLSRIFVSNNTAPTTSSNWTLYTTLNSREYDCICYSSDLNLFCAIAPGYVHTSSTGGASSTWTETSLSDTTTVWNKVIWVSSIGLFIATSGSRISSGTSSPINIATTGNSSMMISKNGTSWTDLSYTTAPNLWTLLWVESKKTLFGAYSRTTTGPNYSAITYAMKPPTNVQKLQYTTNGSTYYDLSANQPATIPNGSSLDKSKITIRLVDTNNEFTASSTDVSGGTVSYPSSAPSAPTINNITPGDTSLNIIFTPGSDGGSAITGYKISTNGGSSFSDFGAITSPYRLTHTNSTFTQQLVNGTPYTIVLRSYNIVGDSSNSNSITSTPRTFPSAPSIISVTPGNTTLIVDFSANSNGGSAITGYKISSTGGSSYSDIGLASSPYTITGLSNGTSYTVVLIAYNVAGDSTTSNSISATPVASTTVPTAPQIDNVTAELGGVSIGFTPPSSDGGSAITGYKYSTDNWTTTSSLITTTTTPLQITGLTPGTPYTIRIKATNSVGDSASSNESQSFIPYTYPSAPLVTSLIAGYEKLTVKFIQDSSGFSPITGYKYSFNGVDYVTTNYTSSPFDITTNITPGTPYRLTLIATNQVDSSASQLSNYATPFTKPSAPTITGAKYIDGQLTITFIAPITTGGVPISRYNYSINGGDYTHYYKP